MEIEIAHLPMAPRMSRKLFFLYYIWSVMQPIYSILFGFNAGMRVKKIRTGSTLWRRHANIFIKYFFKSLKGILLWNIIGWIQAACVDFLIVFRLSFSRSFSFRSFGFAWVLSFWWWFFLQVYGLNNSKDFCFVTRYFVCWCSLKWNECTSLRNISIMHCSMSHFHDHFLVVCKHS